MGGVIIIIAGQNYIRDNFRKCPLGSSSGKALSSKTLQSKDKQYITSGGGLSLLNGPVTLLP
jgi:hypothetical protein